MKLTIIKSTTKAHNIIFLADKISDLKEQLSKENFQYFRKCWKDEDMQYIKNIQGYVFVVKTAQKDLDTIRKTAFSIHDIIKNHYTEVCVSSKNLQKTLTFLERWGMIKEG